jgi:hypothetical protein
MNPAITRRKFTFFLTTARSMNFGITLAEETAVKAAGNHSSSRGN